MKKTSRFITKNDGFILLHVLFVVTLLFILVSSAVSSYRNDIYITHRQIQQIEAETLFQMAREQYKRELQDEEILPEEAKYSYPKGKVIITLEDTTDQYAKLQFRVEFPNQEPFFSINHLLVLE